MKNRFKSSENFEMAHQYENAENAGTSVNDESFHQAQKRNSPTLQRVDNAITTFEPVAIVGMTGRFPMAKDTDALWENLIEGRDCITEIPLSRWDWKSIYGDP